MDLAIFVSFFVLLTLLLHFISTLWDLRVDNNRLCVTTGEIQPHYLSWGPTFLSQSNFLLEQKQYIIDTLLMGKPVIVQLSKREYPFNLNGICIRNCVDCRGFPLLMLRVHHKECTSQNDNKDPTLGAAQGLLSPLDKKLPCLPIEKNQVKKRRKIQAF